MRVNQLMQPKFLFFDVGETLVSEHRMWAQWADWLEVPEPTFFAALGATIAERRDHTDVFGYFRRPFDLAAERRARHRAGVPDGFAASDLYPDTLPALRWAQTAGYRIGFAGSESDAAEGLLQTLGIEAEIVGAAQGWDVAKPAVGFFEKIVALTGLAPAEIVYIGDRIDNDVLPALAAGMQAIFVKRGPWGVVQSAWPEAAQAPVTIGSLIELEQVLD